MTELLNGCVYRFFGNAAADHGLGGLFSFVTSPDFDKKLEEVSSSLNNGTFDEKLDEFLETAQGNLADDGNI